MIQVPAIIIVIIVWIIFYFISRARGDSEGTSRAEYALTGPCGFKGCGIVLLIVLIIVVALIFYVLSLFD